MCNILCYADDMLHIKQQKLGCKPKNSLIGIYFFLLASIFGKFLCSPYEVFSSSYGRTGLIPLNLTGESLLLGRDQKAQAAAVLPASHPHPSKKMIGHFTGQRTSNQDPQR